MKTVQETLKNINKDELIGTYFYKYPIDFDYLLFKHPEYGEISINELKNKFRQNRLKTIDKLSSVDITPPEDGHRGLLYAHRILKDGFDEPETELVLLDELLEKGSAAQEFAYFYTPQSEIAGFLIADTPYTQQHLYSLLADVLHEASFFGPEQEYLEEEIKKLEKSREEVEEGNYSTAEEVFEHLREEFGLEDERDPETDEEEKARNDANIKAGEYNRMTAAREKAAIQRDLKSS